MSLADVICIRATGCSVERAEGVSSWRSWSCGPSRRGGGRNCWQGWMNWTVRCESWT